MDVAAVVAVVVHCALQNLTKKGAGYCTVECLYCVEFRGFRPSAEEKKEILSGMTMLLRCDIATHFLKMMNAYFSRP
jgi:hypothetical protein